MSANPVTVIGRVGREPGRRVPFWYTTYPLSGDVPLLVGAVTVKLAEPGAVETALTRVGADGVVRPVTTFDALD